MGLDMYLSKRTYVGNKYREGAQLIKVTVPSIKDQEGVISPIKPGQIKDERISSIEEEIGYWRKANAIHKWFVENVQDGEDDCRDAYVSREQLQELLETVKTVLADHSKAEELLPPQSGFFFGSTEIDQYYFEDLEATKKILEAVLAEDGGDFYYSSSW